MRFGTDDEYYNYATIKIDASKDKTNEINRKNDYKKYVSTTSSEPEPTVCDICGAELADGKTHTDADHETCADCGAVYHKDAEHECQDAE